jgi:hypothetical protein
LHSTSGYSSVTLKEKSQNKLRQIRFPQKKHFKIGLWSGGFAGSRYIAIDANLALQGQSAQTPS